MIEFQSIDGDARGMRMKKLLWGAMIMRKMIGGLMSLLACVVCPGYRDSDLRSLRMVLFEFRPEARRRKVIVSAAQFRQTTSWATIS